MAQRFKLRLPRESLVDLLFWKSVRCQNVLGAEHPDFLFGRRIHKALWYIDGVFSVDSIHQMLIYEQMQRLISGADVSRTIIGRQRDCCQSQFDLFEHVG
jgi:hypothetical protein